MTSRKSDICVVLMFIFFFELGWCCFDCLLGQGSLMCMFSVIEFY